MKTLQEIKAIAEKFIEENSYLIETEKCEVKYEVETEEIQNCKISSFTAPTGELVSYCTDEGLSSAYFTNLETAYKSFKEMSAYLHNNSTDEISYESIAFRLRIETENDVKTIELDFLS